MIQEAIIRKNLYRFLNELGNTVERRYPALNRGGCCVYASLVGTELAQLGFTVRGIVGRYDHYDNKDIDQVRKNVRFNTVDAWENHGIHFHHVGVEFCAYGAWRSYDSSGVKPASNLGKWVPYQGRLTLEEVKDLAAQEEGWNPTFRRKDIPIITSIVRSSFRRQRMLTPTEMLVNRIKGVFK